MFVFKELSVKKHMGIETENNFRVDLSGFGLQSFGIDFESSVASVRGTGRSL